MSTLSFRNVWVEYGNQVVLERINLEITSGTFLSIVGPSGAGKSTFLRLILGQERPSQGAVLLDGEPFPAEPGPDRGIVFQRYSVFPHLTVLGNVLLGYELAARPFTARLFGTARKQAVEKSRALIDAVGLGAHCDKYPSALSGGMQQRLAIAQALAKQPRVLLLDEPFGALDAFTREDLWCILRDLWAEQRFNVILVTHDLRESTFLADTVYVMSKGPGRIVVKMDIDLPRPRDLELTYTKE
ncbi:ABC transporter ATP-binding protein, partial [Bradyrhizobium sp.]|uniref:ABC transporter ATP-binding protein n=1 Tax=Bradyrhizobium sp. TaxID=376 RepID=UPI00391BF932